MIKKSVLLDFSKVRHVDNLRTIADCFLKPIENILWPNEIKKTELLGNKGGYGLAADWFEIFAFQPRYRINPSCTVEATRIPFFE
jgi:hypothetical protein